MFGHQDDSQQPQSSGPFSNDQSVAMPTADDATWTPPAPSFGQAADVDQSAPLLEAQADDGYITVPSNAPASSDSQSQDPATSAPAIDSPVVGGSGLLDIKQQALQQLSPLVGHLDQSPEEKFRTTMMMIQASDNQELLKEAFEIAQQITDDKSRAQALLDIINEINYFTQLQNS